MYKQAIEEIKQADCKSGLILCSEDNPASVLAVLEWKSKEHHQRWCGTTPHARFRGTVAGPRWKKSTGDYYRAATI